MFTPPEGRDATRQRRKDEEPRHDLISEALAKLDRFALAVGQTPMIELRNLGLSNGNRLFAKCEFMNPSGNLYDRVYANIMRTLLASGQIIPGETTLVETTSGNAGTAFAHICARLGFRCHVILPADTPANRKAKIYNYGAEIIDSPKGKYVSGAVKTLKNFIQTHGSEYRAGTLICPDHSRNELSLESVAMIADEIVSDLGRMNLVPDILVLGCGNGTTILGTGGRLKVLMPHVRCMVFDPVEAPVAHGLLYPDLVQDYSQERQHRIIGTGGLGVSFPFLHDERFSRCVDGVSMVTDWEMVEAMKSLERRERRTPGHSSAAAVSVALRIAKEVSGKNIVTIFYDDALYYN
ncbi:pyridoxal-phosphate dependent enzyme [Magnetospirillum sulfuroxidans]|uniref:Pyridoxal-phosphate dependent enzyme n=1 Tax=Magnetospirillum sulfuroxidans TaxID=611300 RepID=A0ABS5IBN3_9PROT|nr:pyridoxal-phosphate dependent enzyme [Magnetospirillum sulfuroxidans]MBR9971805.1 pyridoxal-phosphate dependent enzyme [Magnetospirillum sulfuroxidans]